MNTAYRHTLCIFYDNSVENALPQLLYRTVDGLVFKQYTEDVPEWAEMLVK